MFRSRCERNPLGILLGDFSHGVPTLIGFVLQVTVIAVSLVYIRSVHVLIHDVISHTENIGLESFLSITSSNRLIIVLFAFNLNFFSLRTFSHVEGFPATGAKREEFVLDLLCVAVDAGDEGGSWICW